MKFAVTFEESHQVTEDSWRTGIRTLIADENTTIGQIREWCRKESGAQHFKQWVMRNVSISEAQEVAKEGT